MNNFLILLLLFFAYFNSNAQSDLVGKTFKTNVLVGKSNPYQKANESIYLNDTEKENPWGNFIVFNADGTFNSYNQEKCGNGCRIKVAGVYEIDGDKISLTVNEVKYMDICATTPKETNEVSLGTFTISKKENAIVLM